MDVVNEHGEIVAAPKPFGQWLLEQGEGVLHGELTDELRHVAAAVGQTGKKGTLTLTITIERQKGSDMIIVSDKVTVKAPEDRRVTLFFEDGSGNLSRRNPFQPELPLQEVPNRNREAIR
jgi:hypothetical protein